MLFYFDKSVDESKHKEIFEAIKDITVKEGDNITVAINGIDYIVIKEKFNSIYITTSINFKHKWKLVYENEFLMHENGGTDSTDFILKINCDETKLKEIISTAYDLNLREKKYTYTSIWEIVEMLLNSNNISYAKRKLPERFMW